MKRKIYDQLLLWKNKRKGKSGVVDRVKRQITSRHNISPIEVKSSTGFTTVSLEKCIKKYETHLAQAYIVHTGDVEKDSPYLYIPLYMVSCL